MRKIVLLASMFLLSGPVWAEAQTARPVFEQTGAFGFCLADRDYPDGRKMTIALSAKGELNLGFTIPKGGFKPQARYDLTLTLEDAQPRAIRAEALDEETLLLETGANARLRKVLSESDKLTLAGGARSLTFELPPMKGVFTDLNACLDKYKNATTPLDGAPKTAEPTRAATTLADSEEIVLADPLPSAAPSPAQTTPPQTPAMRSGQMESAELPAELASLLNEAGFTSFKAVDLSDVPEAERPADYVWEHGAVLGGVRERVVPADKNLNDLVGLHIQGLKTKCEGRFNATLAREKTFGDKSVREADVSCAPTKGERGPTIDVALLFILDKNRVFTVFTHEGSRADRAEIIAARDKLAKVTGQ